VQLCAGGDLRVFVFLDCSKPDGLMVVDPQTDFNADLDAFYASGRKPHCKALLRTMGNVMSRRVKSQ
jgi:hypothetical protein